MVCGRAGKKVVVRQQRGSWVEDGRGRSRQSIFFFFLLDPDCLFCSMLSVPVIVQVAAEGPLSQYDRDYGGKRTVVAVEL